MHKYLFVTKYLSEFHDLLDDIMTAKVNWAKGSLEDQLDYLYVDGTNLFDPKLYGKEAYLKNVVGNQSIINDKEKLYKNLGTYDKNIRDKYMMKQHYITKQNYKQIDPQLFSQVWIIKPVKEGSNKGIEVLETYDQYINYIEKSTEKYSKYGWVLELYITNPLLYENKKFHIRMIYLWFEGKGYLFKEGYILTAKEDYKKSDYRNRDIHETHYFGLPFCHYPSKFIEAYGKDKEAEVFNNLKEYIHAVLQISDLKLYKESKHGYGVFGFDVLLTDDFEVKILEINKEIGLGPFTGDEWTNFLKHYIQGQLEVTLDTLIPPENDIPKLDVFVDITNFTGGYYKKYIKYKQKYLNLKAGNLQNNTYLIKTSFQLEDLIGNLLDNRGNWKPYSSGSVITYLYLDGEYVDSTEYHQYKKTITNMIGKSKNILGYKHLLHRNLSEKFPEIHTKYMMKYYINTITLEDFGSDIWIIKPVSSSGGIHNKVLTKYSDYQAYLKQNFSKYGYVIERYIDEPLLFQDYKFHIRIYMLFFQDKGYIFKYGPIIKADKKYEPKNYTDISIIDTHHRGQTYIQYPDAFISEYGQDDSDKVFSQVLDLHKYLIKLLLDKCYPDSEYCYQLFSSDIMVLPDFTIKLLECNQFSGLKHDKNEMLEFYTSFFEGILQRTVDIALPPQKLQEENTDWIQLL